jgi:hypothetical protein
MLDFEALFEIDAPLSNLSRTGQYTVVEVYIDGCMWCQEFETAFGPFQSRRPDVSWVRVHDPGEMSFRFEGNSGSDHDKFLKIK